MAVTTIIQPANVTFSANDIYFKLQSSYSGDDFPANYAIIVEIKMRPNPGVLDPYDEIMKLELRPDADGYVDFNISSVIDKAIRSKFEIPPIPDESNFQDPYISPITYQYALTYAERSGNPPELSEWSVLGDGEYFAVLGGIDRTKWHRTYLADITSGDIKCIFSRNITNRKVGRNQLHWINWWNPTSGSVSAYCEFKIYDDSMTLVSTVTSGTASVPAYQPVCFPGVFSINLGTLVPRMVTMQIKGAGDLSPVIRFLIDNNEYDNNRDLIYLNSYNVPDGIRCIGDFTREINTQRQKSNNLEGVNGVATSKREVQQVGVDWNHVYTYRTGYITKQELEALDEMFVVNMVWEMYDGLWRSLDIIDDGKTFLDTGTMVDSLAFQATDAVKKKIIPQESRI